MIDTQRFLASSLVLIIALGLASARPQQPQKEDRHAAHESVRSDKFTGGKIETAELQPNQPEIKITVDVPSFQLTLWQNGKEVKTWRIGVGRRDFPLVIGDRSANSIIWNPSWIPPDSDWVKTMDGVAPGEVIRAGDKRNPMGKLKIPLGDAYLIHQAKGTGDLGHLVSHGCIRMMKQDLFDLAERIVTARGLSISAKQIERAKKTTATLYAKLDPGVQVDINYDTQVVEGGLLHVYFDVYGRGTNTPARLRAELESSGVDTANIDDNTLKAMIAKATRANEFVVSIDSVKQGRALEDGQTLPLIPPTPKKQKATNTAATGQSR